MASDRTVLLAATQTLTNKTLTSPKINEDVAVTATATEINTALDGILATFTEINRACDGILATAAEINTVCDGATVTAVELNRSADISARVVTSTATALSLTVTEHAERLVVVNSNSTVANTFSLPAAAGTGAKFTVINNIAQTQGSVVVAANGTDVMNGICINVSTTEEAAQGFLTSASSDKISLNATTTGGEGAGDRIECVDIAANTWSVMVVVGGSGTLATPFSAT